MFAFILSYVYILRLIGPISYLGACYIRMKVTKSLISKIGLDRATRCDEPVLKPIGGHLEKTTQSSVFVSKSCFEASEIGLEYSQYVSFDNSKHKYY